MQLHRHQEKFATLNTDVVYVSFGPEHWINVWKQQLESPYPILLDEERTVYGKYNVNRSPRGVFSLKWPILYIKRRKIPKAKGDPFQMGGDFIIDKQGMLRFIHVFAHTADQAPVDKLIDTLETIVSQQKENK